jgi:hypothetical protein
MASQQCDALVFLHLERTGGTSVRAFMSREVRYFSQWSCLGQACKDSPPACPLAGGDRGVLRLLRLLGHPELATSGCRLFAELHNNEWRSAALWNVLPGLMRYQRSRGCRANFFTVLRDPYEQIISELLYFKTMPEGDHAAISAGIVARPENMLMRLALIEYPQWRDGANRLEPPLLLAVARQMCRQLSLLDTVLFTTTLDADWGVIRRAHNMSARPIRHDNRGPALDRTRTLAALVDEHLPNLTRYHRLSRATYDLIAAHREFPLHARCKEAQAADPVPGAKM